MNIVKIEEKHMSLIGLTICSSKMVGSFFNSICSNNNAHCNKISPKSRSS